MSKNAHSSASAKARTPQGAVPDDDRTDLSWLMAQGDANIDYGDAPKTTPADWANAKMVRFRFTGSRIDNRGSKKTPRK